MIAKSQFPTHVDLRVAHASGLRLCQGAAGLLKRTASLFVNPEGRRHAASREACATSTSADFRHAEGKDLFTARNARPFSMLIVFCRVARSGWIYNAI